MQLASFYGIPPLCLQSTEFFFPFDFNWFSNPGLASLGFYLKICAVFSGRSF